MIGKERVRVRVIWEEWLAFEFGKRKKIEDGRKRRFLQAEVLSLGWGSNTTSRNRERKKDWISIV